MGVLLGIAAAISWGLGDYLITRLTRRVGTSRALLAIQIFSALAWAALLVSKWPATGGAADVGWLLAAAACHVIGLVFVYRAFEIGTLSIVSPISAGFAVVTALLSMASGERPPALTLIGAGLLVGGVVLATRTPSDASGTASGSIRGVPEALLSALGFGAMFWIFYFHVQPHLGFALPLVVLKVAAMGSSFALLVWSGARDPRPSTPVFSVGTLGLAAAAAAADTAAWLAYIGGTASTYATVVTALASLFSVFTVLLAWRLMRERLAPHQWIGVGTVLLGILLVSV
jgi:drug/metabolite transporter (DMT)-like permease